MSRTIVGRFIRSLRSEGLTRTSRTVLTYPWRYLKDRYQRKRLSAKFSALHQLEEKFTFIFQHNQWGNAESVSGHGSTLAHTENLRKHLPELMRDFSVGTVFDAPCGDFNWMRVLLHEYPVEYIGGEIVKPLVEKLNASYQTSQIRFIHIDLTSEVFPTADLMICRDCLLHLSYEDTRSLLGSRQART